MTARGSLSPEIFLIVAVADNGVIGQGNTIPWRLKSDLRRFKALTLDKPVLMGRKTFESIGKALPARTNIVVTRDKNFRAPGAVVTTSFADARAIARADALRRFATEMAVIGGAEIYAQSIDSAGRLEVTEVHTAPEGDAFFAPVDLSQWTEVARVRNAAASGDSADFSYVTYRRRASH